MWYLIKTPCWNAPYWLEDFNKDFWRNANGGLTPKHEDDIIYETSEAEYEDLDHKKTGLFVKRSDTGFLDPEGNWYPCHFHKHRLYAELILKATFDDLKKRGWVYVAGINASARLGWYCEMPLTSEQQAWLSNHGHEVTTGRL